LEDTRRHDEYECNDNDDDDNDDKNDEVREQEG
jgi:hypothetical protein